jgi:predicted transcriptional regulator
MEGDAVDKRLADSEWVILKALWDKPAQTMKQIVESVRTEQPDVNWGYKTYHTYLRNMAIKGLITAEDRNLKDKLYAASVSREDALRAEGSELLSRRGYYGSVGRLVAMMAEDGQLSGRDVEELKALAARLEKDGEQR